MIRVARGRALKQFERHAPVEAWLVDDTGIPKKGKHSVRVARQYCGVLGKQDNCQVSVTVSLVNEAMRVPPAHRLCLPEISTHHLDDEERRECRWTSRSRRSGGSPAIKSRRCLRRECPRHR
jgi:SRSO17 transposase